jgi:hypothetical protein
MLPVPPRPVSWSFGRRGFSGVEAFGADTEWFLAQSPQLWVRKFPADRGTAVRIASGVAQLLLPEWRAARPNDSVPVRAVEVALANPDGSDAGLRQHARALAKACGESRRRSLGYEHRIAEAARALANAAAAISDEAALEAVGEALAKVEDHLLYKLSVAGVYGKEAEVRGQMLRRAVEASVASAEHDATPDRGGTN